MQRYCSKIVFLAVCAILFFTPLIFLPYLRTIYYAPKILILQIFVILSVLCLCINFLITKNICVTINKLDVVVSIKIGILYLLFYSVSQYDNTQINIAILLYMVCFYWIIKIDLEQEGNNVVDKINAYFAVIIFTCILQSAIGLLQFTKIVPFDGDIVYESIVIGTMGNANAVASYLAISFPFILLFSKKYFAIHHNYFVRVMVAAVIVFILCVFILTKSRGALIALMFGLLVFYQDNILHLLQRYNRMIPKKILMAVIFSIMILLPFFLYSLNTSSSIGRIFIWRVSSLMIQEYPLLGIGYGNYPAEYLDYQREFFEKHENSDYFDYAADVRHAHNEFINTFAETGIWGIVLLILLFIYCLKYYRYIMRNNANSHLKDITTAIMASISIIFIHSFFDSPLSFTNSAIAFCFNLSVLSVIFDKVRMSEKSKYSIVGKHKIFYSISMMLLLGLTIFTTAKIINISKTMLAYNDWIHGKKEANKYNWRKSIYYYTDALKHVKFGRGVLCLHQGISMYMIGEYESAINNFNDSQQYFDDQALHKFKAMCFQKLKKYDIAEKEYHKFIGTFPNLLTPRYLLGKMYIEMNKKEKAIAELNRLMEINPRIVNERTLLIKQSSQALIEGLK